MSSELGGVIEDAEEHETPPSDAVPTDALLEEPELEQKQQGIFAQKYLQQETATTGPSNFDNRYAP